MAFDDQSSGDPFSPAGGGGQSPLDLKKLLSTVRRFYWIAILTCILGILGSLLYLKTARPMYRSTAEIKVERRAAMAGGVGGPAALEGATTPEDLKTIEKSFLSALLMKRVITKLDLAKRDNFVGPDRPASSVTEDDLIGNLLEHSEVALVQDTRLIQVSFENWNPANAQEVTEALVAEGLAYDREQRIESLGGNVEYLQEEKKRLEANLKSSEEKLSAYTKKLGSVSIDQEFNIVADQLRDLNSRQTQAKAERLKLESDYEQIQAVLNDPDKLLAIESIAKVPAVERLYLRAGELRGQLVKLAQRYRDANPLLIQTKTELNEVEATLKQEILQAPRTVEVALAAAKRNEEGMAREQAAQEKRVIEIKDLSIESQVIQRQIDADRMAYETTLKRLNEEMAQSRSQPVLLQVVQPAGGAIRTGVMPPRVLATGLMMGLMVGAGLIFLIMQLDMTIKSPEDAESAFRLSVLAAIPEYEPHSNDEKSPGKERAKQPVLSDLMHCPIINDKYSTVAESFRSLRASLQIVEDSPRDNLILITSPLPSEGKSFCALNLAVAMANSGQRTLLVDAQLRKPVLEERIFAARGYHGLSDYLQGTADFSSILRAAPVPNLDVVTAGSRTPQPAEILSRHRFEDFLDEAQPHYDRIIFDSAPITAVSDTLSFARFFPVTCLVLKAGKTPRNAMNRALELLARAGARPFGLIMNFAPHKLRSSFEGYEAIRNTPETEGGLDFPKICRSCGRVYKNFDDYMSRTHGPQELDAEGGDGEAIPTLSEEFFRTCECGAQVIVSSSNRRDTTESGLRRRNLFGELQDLLMEAGMPREESRAKLLLTLKMWRNEIYTEASRDSSEAGRRRHQLFGELLNQIVKTGLDRETARARLLEAIQSWRGAP